MVDKSHYSAKFAASARLILDETGCMKDNPFLQPLSYEDVMWHMDRLCHHIAASYVEVSGGKGSLSSDLPLGDDIYKKRVRDITSQTVRKDTDSRFPADPNAPVRKAFEQSRAAADMSLMLMKNHAPADAGTMNNLGDVTKAYLRDFYITVQAVKLMYVDPVLGNTNKMALTA